MRKISCSGHRPLDFARGDSFTVVSTEGKAQVEKSFFDGLVPYHFVSPPRAAPPASKNSAMKNLPNKICPVCRRPFDWRKKWAKCWEEVKYCSQRCRRAKLRV